MCLSNFKNNAEDMKILCDSAAMVSAYYDLGDGKADDHQRTELLDVCYCADKSYRLPLGVAIISLIKHNPTAFIHLFVSTDTPDEESVFYDRIIKEYNARGRLYVINNETVNSLPGVSAGTKYISPATYYRFLAAEYLCESGVERVLYIDGDTICIGSLHELNEFYSNTDKPLLAVADNIESLPKNHFNNIRFEGSKYFNAGVMLINLTEYKKRKILSQAFFMLMSYPERFFYNDQDVLNILYCENVFWLPERFNYFQVKDRDKPFPQDTKIIHFISEHKPWYKWYCVRKDNIWEKYHKESILCDIIDNRAPNNPSQYRLLAKKQYRDGEYVDSFCSYFSYIKNKLF